MSDAIVFEDVQVRVASAGRILGPVSLRVGAGERWALLGPNGSGKTTLLSVAGAWRQPSSGRAWVLGASSDAWTCVISERGSGTSATPSPRRCGPACRCATWC